MMKNLVSFRWMALFVAAFLFTISIHAANFCVGPSATGNGSGSDWNNKVAWSSVTLTRANTYYLEDGSYGGRSFSTANSGTTLITIKKAISTDHATDTGWSSGMGDGQATFSGTISFSSSYWVFDGQTGGGPGSWTSGHGFFIQVTDNSPVINITPSSQITSITIRHVKMEGSNSASNGGNQGFHIASSGGTAITASYLYMFNIGNCPFFITRVNNMTVEYSYIGRYNQSTANHAEIASIWGGSDNITWRFNVFTYIVGTGGLMFDNHEAASPIGMKVYGNVFYQIAGDSWSDENGAIGGWTGGNAEEMHNVLVYNNSFVSVNMKTLSPAPAIFSGCQAKNNLWYNCQSPVFNCFPTHNYNYFINSGGTHSEANGTSSTSGDPFANYAGLDFSLKANTSPGENLGSPYNVDPTGRTRTTWTRGAYEYGLPTTNPAISVTPPGVSVFATPSGQSVTNTFLVRNAGGGSLNGNATGLTAPFSFVSATTYTLASGDPGVEIKVRFSPTSAGSFNQTLTFSGGSGTTIVLSGVATPPILPGAATFEAESGLVTAPFSVSGGYISQTGPNATSVASGGKAVYNFTVPTTGNYIITAMVNAPDLTQNSFFVGIDRLPVDPNDAWDILPPTTGFETRPVSIRGTGTAELNEFDPKTFWLTAGSHSLTIVGREPNTLLDRIDIRPYTGLPAPPTGLILGQ